MKVKIEYDYRADNHYPYKAKISTDNATLSVGSSKISFEEAKAEALDYAKNKEDYVVIPQPEEIDL